MNITFTASQWIFLYIGAITIGMAKTSISSLGILAVVIFALVLDNVMVSAGFMLSLMIVADIVSIVYYRAHVQWKIVVPLLPWAMIGVVIAHVTEQYINADILRIMLGILLLLVLILSFFKIERVNTEQQWIAWLTGSLAGFVSMFANAAGPIMNIYLLSKKLDKIAFVGSSVWYYAIINIFKLLFRVSSNTVTTEISRLNLRLLPGVFVGTLLGVLLIRIIPESIFKNVILILTFIAIIYLLIGS